jgi:hypothetical protein
MKMQIIVMPVWIAGIQVAGMSPETSLSIWIPALHAEMTDSRWLCLSERAPWPCIFKEVHEKFGKLSHFV